MHLIISGAHSLIDGIVFLTMGHKIIMYLTMSVILGLVKYNIFLSGRTLFTGPIKQVSCYFPSLPPGSGEGNMQTCCLPWMWQPFLRIPL